MKGEKMDRSFRGSQKRKTDDDVKRPSGVLKTARMEKADETKRSIQNKPEQSKTNAVSLVMGEFPESPCKEEVESNSKTQVSTLANKCGTSAADVSIRPKTPDIAMGEYTEAFFQQVSPTTLEEVCQAAEVMEGLKKEESEYEGPLSPIVGYTFSSDDETDDSPDSEPNPAIEKCLQEMNAKLAKIIGRELSPEPSTPRSLERQRMRKKRHRAGRKSLLAELGEASKSKSDVTEVDGCKALEVKLDEDINTKKEKDTTDDHLNVPEFPNPEIPLSVGFTTASGKPVSVSSEALRKAQGLFQNIDLYESKNKYVATRMSTTDDHLNGPESPNPEIPLSVGFTTASGKPVSVSSEALRKAQGLFQNIDSYESKNKYVATRMSTIENHLNAPESPNPEIPLSVGFTTASGKPVSVSSEALRKAQGLFQNIDSYESKNKYVANRMSKTDDHLNVPESLNPEIPLTAGFTTASGKPVSVSSEALRKAQGLFQNIDSYESKNKYVANRMSNPTIYSSNTSNIDVKPSVKANTPPGDMTQDVLDCIQAFLADDEDDPNECF